VGKKFKTLHCLVIEKLPPLLYLALLGCVNLLNKAKDEFKEALKADFISALEGLGNNADLIAKVKEKGLPTDIIVSSELFGVCYEHLSKYADVHESDFAPEKTMMCAWRGEELMHP
jgi:hypothetical protein